MTLFAVLVAPLIYWVLGAPLAWLIARERYARYVWLCGLFVAGFAAELAVICSLPTKWCLVAAAAVCAALVVRRRDELMAHSRGHELAVCYAVAVAAAALSPFPVLGSWSGDWHHAYEMGQAMLLGDLPSTMLARPPLFGAAMSPVHIIVGDLPSLQLMAVVASAGAALACLELGCALFDRELPPAILLSLLLSTFFLHHTAAAWSKLMSAGFLVLSWARVARPGGSAAERWKAAALFGAAVATHESAVLWGIANLAFAARPRTLPRLFREGGRLLLGVLLIAGPFLIWTIARYGMAARVSANPVITDKSADPLLIKSAVVLLGTFVPWSPVTVLQRWLAGPAPFSSAVLAKELYWFVTSTVTLLASTALGILLPALLVLGPRAVLGAFRALRAEASTWLLAITAGTVATALLSPFGSNDGTLQVAHAPVALLAFVAIGAHALSLGKLRRLVAATALFGLLPWALLNGGMSVGLKLSAAFEARIRGGSEGDYARVLAHGLNPLGLGTFPWLFLLSLVAAVALLRRFRPAMTHGVRATPMGQVTPSSSE